MRQQNNEIQSVDTGTSNLQHYFISTSVHCTPYSVLYNVHVPWLGLQRAHTQQFKGITCYPFVQVHVYMYCIYGILQECSNTILYDECQDIFIQEWTIWTFTGVSWDIVQYSIQYCIILYNSLHTILYISIMLYNLLET